MAIYFSAVFLLLGIGLYPLITEFFPGREPLQVFNQYFLLWLVLELVMRFMLQTLPVISIKPFLVSPIPKRKTVNYVLLKSLFSFFNFLPLLIIIPFGIITWYKTGLPFLSILGWMVTAYFLMLCVNYCNFLLKKKFADDLTALLPYAVVFLVLFGLEYFGIFSSTEAFGDVMDYVVLNPWLAVVPVMLVFLLYKWNQKILESRFYLDDSLKGKVREANTTNFEWVRKFGDIAPFLQLDLKLIWRNKRPKTTIYLSLLMVPYGLLIFGMDSYEDSPMRAFAGIFMTGMFMINFGQFIPAWDSSYYSMMMSQNVRLQKYLASKAGLMTFSVIILSILCTPYIYFGMEVLLLILACALYNIGVNVPVLMYSGSYNRKRIDLEKSPFMNYQGTGAAQWLVGIPLMAFPILIFWLVDWLVSFEAATAVLAGLGLLGLLLRNILMEQIGHNYKKNKYAMINGFKQTE